MNPVYHLSSTTQSSQFSLQTEWLSNLEMIWAILTEKSNPAQRLLFQQLLKEVSCNPNSNSYLFSFILNKLQYVDKDFTVRNMGLWDSLISSLLQDENKLITKHVHELFWEILKKRCSSLMFTH